MEKLYRTPRQLLLDYSNWISSEHGNALSHLLDVLDDNNIGYVPCPHIHTENLPDKIYFMGTLGFDLAIKLDNGSQLLINLEMPEEALGQMEEIPGYGNVPSKAYEWLLRYMLPVFDDDDVESLYMLSQQSDEERNKGFQLRLKLIEENTSLPEDDRQRLRSELDKQIEFFKMSETDREKYFDSCRQKLDFYAMSKEERYTYLKAVDAILHPVICDNGFPNWLNPDFISKILKLN